MIDPNRFSPSGIALVVTNLLPLAGVFFFGWTVFEVLALYWLENVVIGILNLPKILTASGRFGASSKDPQQTELFAGDSSEKLARFGLAAFFFVHLSLIHI